MQNRLVTIGLIGYGNWGPNLARNFFQLPEANLVAVCDLNEERLGHIRRYYPLCEVTRDHTDLLDNPGIDAIAIATPARTHYSLAKDCLRAGKHVLVEKPPALASEECQELVEIAAERRKVLMVGHTFIYNAAVNKLKEYVTNGEMGDVCYIYSSRLNLGVIRRDVNALWNFAPHDISILLYLLDAEPYRVSARGFSYVQDGVEDVVFMTLDFPSGVGANVHMSWLDPNKVRRMTVVGSEKMVVYDDVNTDAKIQVYDKGIKKESLHLGNVKGFGEFQLLVRTGDVIIPKIDFVEPLKVECAHFIECIREGKIPLTDGTEGLRVVRILEAAQKSMDSGGIPQDITNEKSQDESDIQVV